MHFLVVYVHLPRQRKLQPDDLAVAANLIQLKSDMKLLQVHMQEKTGKVPMVLT